MSSIYLVIGEAGEYSDHELWVLETAYPTKEQADQAVADLYALNEKVKTLLREHDCDGERLKWQCDPVFDEIKKETEDADPNMEDWGDSSWDEPLWYIEEHKLAPRENE